MDSESFRRFVSYDLSVCVKPGNTRSESRSWRFDADIVLRIDCVIRECTKRASVAQWSLYRSILERLLLGSGVRTTCSSVILSSARADTSWSYSAERAVEVHC